MDNVFSDTLAQKLQSFREMKAAEVKPPPLSEETLHALMEMNASGNIPEGAVVALLNPTSQQEPGHVEDDKEDAACDGNTADARDDGDLDAAPMALDAPATELSYALCRNRLHRNFLRHYLLEVKHKKERVFMNEDELLVTSIPYMKGAIEIILQLDGSFATYLVGKSDKNPCKRFPFKYILVPAVDQKSNNDNNGKINGLTDDGATKVMEIAEKHAIHWFSMNNRYRRFSNIEAFRSATRRWKADVQAAHLAKEKRRDERRAAIDRMILEAKEKGYARQPYDHAISASSSVC